MKVLFLTINLGGGGAERVLVNLVNKMADDNYDITVRALVNYGINKALLSSKIKYEYIFKKSFRGMNYLYLLPHKWIYNKVAYGQFDIIVVYIHGVLTKIVSYAPKDQKTVAYLHANMQRSPFIKSFRDNDAIQKCFSGYNRIISVSQEVQSSFIQKSGINDQRLMVIYNTFDVEGILRKSKEYYNAKKYSFNLCSVGKLEKVKGYLRLSKIIKRLYDENFNIHLTIVGEGPQRKELESFIKSNNLLQNITLTGFDTNPYKYIANSDLFVCSSYSEGFSSVVAESLILGVPVITTDCPGMKEMLGNNEFGIITENSTDALYKGIKQLLSEKDSLHYYRNKAQERGAFFSPRETVSAVEKMLEIVNNE